jgi:hypothetical protein
MIYKNFYIKYKMSQEINSKDEEVNNIRLNISEEPEAEADENPESVKEEILENESPNGDLEEIIEEKNIPKSKEIILKLGDVIWISDPSNEILNDNVFLIEYIDSTKIKLINSESFEKTILSIDSNGLIGDGSIQSIKILSSNPEEGYAKQNDLLPGTWVNIYFGGDIPTVITGEIINLEEDMIELKTTDGDNLFINFNYQGIPEDLPIETFEIRPAIKKTIPSPEEVEEPIEENEEEIDRRANLEEGEVTPDQLVERGEEEVITQNVVRQKIDRMFFDLNDLQLGDVVRVEEYINIDRDKYRYNIDSQTNDLLEELISNIPNSKRTSNVLNSIHIMITRFIQLRQISSTFDSNQNINGIVKKTADDRPLAEFLSEFKNNLYWIMFVAKNVKKIYPDNAKAEFKRYDDYETLNENDNLLEMETLFNNYYSNQSIEGQNKYANLYHSLDSYMTPFYSVNPDVQDDVFSSTNGIIIEGDVATNTNAIIDNLGKLYSTIVAKSELTNRKFVIQKYKLGEDRLHASNFKGPNMVAHRVKISNNDSISISSIVTLPEPTVRFSQINLPGTNLLVKSNLNLHFLGYWQLLKQKTEVTPVVIDGFDNDIEYDDTNFVDNIKQYILDLSEYERPADLTNLDIYKIFLRTIIPKIRVLFMLVKKYIKGRLSLVDVINYLEPFMIYPIDLTYMQYKEINTFIIDKIREYNRVYREYSMGFASLKYVKSATRRGQMQELGQAYIYSNELFDLLNDNNNLDPGLKMQIFQDYGFENPNGMECSGSEFLKKITVADYGNLYNTAVALSNIQLMYPNELSSIFEKDKNKLKEIIEKDKSEDKCANYIVAKKYYSLDKMMEDNDKPIFFDKEFDTTNYDIIEEKYKRQRDQLSSEDFSVFLTNEFVNKGKMDEPSAEYMATTLINQAKKVREGDYALLVNVLTDDTPESLEYYVRNNETWVLDKNVDSKAFIKDDDILCNMQLSCLYNDAAKGEDKCESNVLAKDNIVNNALKQILDQFDNHYNITKEELNSKIKTHLDYFIKIYDKLQQIKKTQFYKYNNQQKDLGLKISEEMKAQVVSPYIKLRDLIMGQNDFVKKQTDIIHFVKKYCRNAEPQMPNIHDGEMENVWWLYCKETNTKLLPSFVSLLADSFVKNNEKYTESLDELKQYIGKLSDDGGMWVDENSGWPICYIDYDVAEGYKDGFVDKSRSIIEEDVGEVMLEKQKEKKERQGKQMSTEATLVSNVITVLSSHMGINIEENRSFIIKIVTELMDDVKVIEKEAAYKKRVDEAFKKGKKLPTYATVYSSTLLYLTLGMYLIGVQISIPSIKTRKTAPGCVRSFSGFPLEGEGDDSGLNYLACVALKSRDPSTVPWNVLPKSEEKIAATIKSFIIRNLLSNPEIDEKIKEKVEYLLYEKDYDEIPEEYELAKWTNFLPPLRKFRLHHLENVSDGFTEELQNELHTGNNRQLEKLLVLDSKIIGFSLAIQEAIQKLVEKKDLLLKSAGLTFMDNACCNESGSNMMTSLQYFINEDRNIEIYNNIVSSLTALLHDINILTESAIILSQLNTKRVFPQIANDFSEETIYQAFIYLCKFQSSVPLNDELAAVCNDKPDYLKKMDTIQEKIAKLKRDGRNYTKQQFLKLFQIVSRNNIIKMSLSSNNKSCTEGLRKLLVIIDETNDDTVPKSLTQKLESLVENNDVSLEVDTKDMRSLKDYLATTNDLMRKEILEFIRIKGKVSGLDLRNITKFMNELTTWKYDQNPRNVNIKISDDAMYNYVNFFKNFIDLFSIVFPTMITNQKMQSIEPQKYWGLARDHMNDIKDMVSSFYKPLEKFYGNKSVINVLNEIKTKTRAIYLLSKVTPVLTNIKIGEKEIYSSFEKRTITLLYEYYILSVLNDYIHLTTDPSMITRMLVIPEREDEQPFSADFLIEQQLRFSEDEQEFIEGDVSKLKQEVAKLLVSYINIMIRTKKTLNVSYDDVEDRVFKLKEAEKYSFTDRLRDMSEEERAVDTILKHHKLGPLYSIGLSKGIKEYDPNNFDHDKKVAEKVAEIQNKLKRHGVLDRDLEFETDDALADMDEERNIELDVALDMNMTDDYDDGDPWGEEQENYDDYD